MMMTQASITALIQVAMCLLKISDDVISVIFSRKYCDVSLSNMSHGYF